MWGLPYAIQQSNQSTQLREDMMTSTSTFSTSHFVREFFCLKYVMLKMEKKIFYSELCIFRKLHYVCTHNIIYQANIPCVAGNLVTTDPEGSVLQFVGSVVSV